ncbi:hypothetical protein FIBSPDRAFT_870547 [Athelia psychrophila]|uniref:C2H2-type domain-containing protein n=1 Tax=Athelia psychrophila TaxID=1759441 RepID=A0A166B2H8_9AGAM|nr:hypothetical protein FIBSPDRAFT_870547 [Fibularhizoctonia sp. CBS 109695]
MTTPPWLNHSVGFDQGCVPASGEFDPTSWDQENFSSDPSSSSTPLFPLTSWDVGTPSYPYPQTVRSTSASAMEGRLGTRGSGYKKLPESALLAPAHAWRPPAIQTHTVNEHAHFPEVNMALPTPPETPTHRSNRSGAPDVPHVPRRPSYTGLRRIAPMPPFYTGAISKKRSHTEAMGTEAESTPTRPAKPTFPCPIGHCDKMFARIEQAKRHAETARQQMDGVFDYPCTVAGCTKEFRLKHKRKEHIDKVHGTD